MVNRARSFVFSTAPPPVLAHAATHALELIRSADGDVLRRQLRENIAIFRPDNPATPIVPRILGENDAALRASAALESEGFLIPAIRYPTVPRGTARLRISLSAAHPGEAVAELKTRLDRLV